MTKFDFVSVYNHILMLKSNNNTVYYTYFRRPHPKTLPRTQYQIILEERKNADNSQLKVFTVMESSRCLL